MDRGELGGAWFKRKAQGLKARGDKALSLPQLSLAVPKEGEVVHVTEVPPHAKLTPERVVEGA